MTDFKVGDVVVVKRGLDLYKKYNPKCSLKTSSGHTNHMGRVMFINQINDCGCITLDYIKDGKVVHTNQAFAPAMVDKITCPIRAMQIKQQYLRLKH